MDGLNRLIEKIEKSRPSLYCAKCDEITPHMEVPDLVFVRGLLCLNCGTVWEAELDPKEIN